MSRPVLLQNYTWTGTFTDVKFDPWALILNDALVQQKLDYYKYLNCKMHLKFVINGTPFHYGKILVSYEPCFSGSPDSAIGDTIRHSQLPNVLLDPTDNQTQEMVLPFFNIRDHITLDQTNGARLGVIFMNELNPLQMANSVSVDPITINVFGWLEDVSLTIPSFTTTATFTAQAEEITMEKMVKEISEADEYGSGPISGIASSVAKATGMLSNVPVIGKFAQGTSMVASTIGSIASIFGFSKPIQLEPPMFMKSIPFTQMAISQMPETVYKLTLDPKQETTLGSNATGVKFNDELSIKYLSNISTYISTSNWTTSNNTGDVLMTIPINPMLSVVGGTVVGTEISYQPVEMTALGFASKPFTQWKGSICYCFQIIASKYHRGRLRFTYVPNGSTFSDTYNTGFTEIIDISNDKEIALQIGYQSASPWTTVGEPWTLGDSIDGSFYNGSLVVSVVNELAAPITTADVDINVWIKGGDDFEVAVPNDTYLDNFSYFQAQAAVCYDSVLVPSSTTDEVNLSTTGEAVSSLRSLVKRYNAAYKLATVGLTHPSALQIAAVKFTIPHFPISYGYQTNGIHQTAGAFAFNYCNMTTINYINQAFVGFRGSLRYKISEMDINSAAVYGPAQVCRFQRTTAVYPGRAVSLTNTTSDNLIGEGFVNSIPSSRFYSGGNLHYPGRLGGVEIESPNYNHLRFTVNHCPNSYYTVGQDYSDCIQYSRETFNATNAIMGTPIEIYVAGGEDFCPIFFRGAPKYYKYLSVPTPLP